MTSAVAIANLALTRAGAERIASFADEEGEAARVIASVWDPIRDAELRARNWNFSIKRAALAALVSEPEWGFTKEYQLPTDCLRVIQVGEFFPGDSATNYRSSSDAAYQIEGRKIITDMAAPLKIRYICRVEDSGQWDALFTEMFACKIAEVICERITQSNTKGQQARADYRNALNMAIRCDAIENPPEPIPTDSWLMSRL